MNSPPEKLGARNTSIGFMCVQPNLMKFDDQNRQSGIEALAGHHQLKA